MQSGLLSCVHEQEAQLSDYADDQLNKFNIVFEACKEEERDCSDATEWFNTHMPSIIIYSTKVLIDFQSKDEYRQIAMDEIAREALDGVENVKLRVEMIINEITLRDDIVNPYSE